MRSLEETLNNDLPLWVLDVDGVVNCWPAPLHHQLLESQDWRDASVGRYKVWWREPVIEFLREVHSTGLADIVWLTTWGEKARTELAPILGLPDFPAVSNFSGERAPGLGWWKWERLKEILGPCSHRPLVWTDDHLVGVVRGFVNAAHAGPRLLITPESNPGLTNAHLEEVRSFLWTQRMSRRRR